MAREKALYEKETNWGMHEVTEGFGKYEGKFVAQSSGWGGARGYFRVFDTEKEAKDYVDYQTRPFPVEDRIAL